jgi:hypothetical protein
LAKGVRGQSKERDESDDGLLLSNLCHQLLSRLPSDVADAFDDMMNETHGKLDSNGSKICTFLPHGWVWAASPGSRELYMVFDPTTEHGMINDVEQAGERIRQYYFNQAVTEFAQCWRHPCYLSALLACSKGSIFSLDCRKRIT